MGAPRGLSGLCRYKQFFLGGGKRDEQFLARWFFFLRNGGMSDFYSVIAGIRTFFGGVVVGTRDLSRMRNKRFFSGKGRSITFSR